MKNDPPLTDPVWLGVEEIEELHDLALEGFGGPPGVVDPEGLESRVQRPRFLARYGDPTLCECAARYGIAFAQSQVFADGNKRTAAYAVALFLRVNGYKFRPPVDELEPVIRAVSTHEMTEEEFREWILQHTRPAE